MPVYSLTSKQSINEEQKHALVNMITDTHCGLTGAPEQFVHVLFSEGYPLINDSELYIHANVRAGRTEGTISEMKETFIQQSSRILDVPSGKIYINLLEIQPKWIMEGGFVMPEPGEEDEWIEKVTKALKERNTVQA